MPTGAVLIVLERSDPVAAAVADRLPRGTSTGAHVDGSAVRAMTPGRWRLDRPGLGIQDERLDARLPEPVRSAVSVLVFPSIHRSERGVRCFTVHALGNPGPAPLGGVPARLGVAAPRAMAAVLRGLSEAGVSLGLPATYEATHHGPELDLATLFAEIALVEGETPGPDPIAALSRVLEEFEEDPADRIAVGIGGGHYAPHFTDLALKRRWAFGHILSRHALDENGPLIARSALERSPGAEGYLFHRATDFREGPAMGLLPRLLDREAPARAREGRPTSPPRALGPGAGT